jgi:hypothetical protein
MANKTENRIGNVGWKACPPSKSEVVVEAQLVKYHPNRYYGELETYRSSGWSDDGEYLSYQGQKIPKQLFSDRESNYLLAWIRLYAGEATTHFEAVEDRLLYIEEQDKLDFFSAYAQADRHLLESSPPQ